jgi:hypothetical protein
MGRPPVSVPFQAYATVSCAGAVGGRALSGGLRQIGGMGGGIGGAENFVLM